MERYLRYGVVWLLAMLSFGVFAQQTPFYGQYFINHYLYNPAMVGLEPDPKAFFLYRQQWAGIEGAPETQAFTLDGRLKNRKIGLGLTFFNDVTNILGKYSIALSASYTVDLADNQQLAFGLSAFAIQNRIFFDRVRVANNNDPNILSQFDSKTTYEANAGIRYSWKKLRLGFAIDQFFQNEVTLQDPSKFESLNFSFVRHYATSVQYDHKLSQDLTLSPLVLIRTVQGLPSQFDGNLTLKYKDGYWVNFGYRHTIGMGFSAGMTIDDFLSIGYTYEIPTTDLQIIGAPSHEVTMGIKLRSFRDKLKLNRAERERNPLDSELPDSTEINYEILDRQQQEIEELRMLNDQLSIDLEQMKADFGWEAENNDAVVDFYIVAGSFRKLKNAKRYQKILYREAGLTTRLLEEEGWYLVYTSKLSTPQKARTRAKRLGKSKAKPFLFGKPWVYKKRGKYKYSDNLKKSSKQRRKRNNRKQRKRKKR